MRNLGKKGLSLSQAQSISNLCNQRCLDIDNKLGTYNNYTRAIQYSAEKLLMETEGVKIDPALIIELLKEKGQLHACQAFLMENIKGKNDMIVSEQKKVFNTSLTEPVKPKLSSYENVALVDEKWGWNQLTASEYNEYLEAEAFASHIGQFIHKGGKLDTLRKELPNIKKLEWFELKRDEKIPVILDVHHTAEDLLSLHEKLAETHRAYEQRVNYYKAKVKNLVTDENARISRENADGIAKVSAENAKLTKEYEISYKAYQDVVLKEKQEFEAARQERIKEVASYRIEVDARFQTTIDKYLKKD